MNIPLSATTKYIQGIWTTSFLRRCYRFRPSCAYRPLFNCLFVVALEPEIDEWARLHRATAARDGLIKVFDVGAEVTTLDATSSHSRGCPTRSDWKQRTIECHTNSVKRIATELSPSVFLTVSEVSLTARVYVIVGAERTEQDGTVRQHDLRAPAHECGAEGVVCSTPLVKLPHRLFSMSMAPSAPHQLVVAGDDPYVCATPL